MSSGYRYESIIIVEKVLVTDEYQISSQQSPFILSLSFFFPMDNYLSVKNTTRYHP